jgi:hypothetical protein
MAATKSALVALICFAPLLACGSDAKTPHPDAEPDASDPLPLEECLVGAWGGVTFSCAPCPSIGKVPTECEQEDCVNAGFWVIRDDGTLVTGTYYRSDSSGTVSEGSNFCASEYTWRLNGDVLEFSNDGFESFTEYDVTCTSTEFAWYGWGAAGAKYGPLTGSFAEALDQLGPEGGCDSIPY